MWSWALWWRILIEFYVPNLDCDSQSNAHLYQFFGIEDRLWFWNLTGVWLLAVPVTAMPS